MTLPHGWTSRRFDQLGELCSGSTPSSSRTEFWDGATVWVTPTDLSRLNTPYLHDSAKHITERGLRNCSARLLPPDSIVLSSRAPIGYVAIPTVPFCTNQGCKSIGLHNSYHSEFVYYAVTAAVPRLKRLGEGTTFAEISKSSLAKAEVVLPIDKAEQAKIADVLSTVDRAIEQTEALIAKQQRIKTGLMQDLLTRGIDEHGNLRSEQTHEFKDSPLGRIPMEWEVITLGAMLKRVRGYLQTGPFGSQLHAHEYVHEGTPVIMPQDMLNGQISTSVIARIPERRANELHRHCLLPNDIVFSRRGDLSRAAGIGEREAGWICGTGCFLLRVSPDAIDSTWLANVYRHHHVQRQVETNAVGSTMPSLNNAVMENLIIAFPKADEQQEIMRRCDAAADGIASILDQLAKMRALKRGLMQDLLTGNRRVTALLEQGDGATA